MKDKLTAFDNFNNEFYQRYQELKDAEQILPDDIRQEIALKIFEEYRRQYDLQFSYLNLTDDIERERLRREADVLLPRQWRRFFRWKQNRAADLADEWVEAIANNYFEKQDENLNTEFPAFWIKKSLLLNLIRQFSDIPMKKISYRSIAKSYGEKKRTIKTAIFYLLDEEYLNADYTLTEKGACLYLAAMRADEAISRLSANRMGVFQSEGGASEQPDNEGAASEQPDNAPGNDVQSEGAASEQPDNAPGNDVQNEGAELGQAAEQPDGAPESVQNEGAELGQAAEQPDGTPGNDVQSEGGASEQEAEPTQNISIRIDEEADEVAFKILVMLFKDGTAARRIQFTEFAEEVGTSAKVISYNIKKLIDGGYIERTPAGYIPTDKVIFENHRKRI